MTTFEEIIKRAEGLGLPIARNQFTATNKKPVPDPPFLVYLSAERQRGDDTKNRIREIEGSLELYTERKADPDLEKQIEEEKEGNEIQLTQALQDVCRREGMAAVLINGRSYDVGIPEAYKRTVSEFGMRFESEDIKIWNR